MNLLPSSRPKGVFFPMLLLKVLGVFFVVIPIVDVVLTYAVFGRAAHGYAVMVFEMVPLLIGGTGLLMRQLWANLFSSFVLCGFGVWLLIAHGPGWNHLLQASLSFTPLLLTLWMRSIYINLESRSADAN